MAKKSECEMFAKFVVIGGGIAGVSCSEQLALEEPDSKIILVSASPIVKTVKNLNKISNRLEEFDVEEEKFSYLEEHYPNCTVVMSFAVSIDSERKEVLLSDDKKIIYEALCICTGGTPKVIATDCPYVLGIRDTETVEIFQKKLINAKRVLIVGNGGIATELALFCSKATCSATYVAGFGTFCFGANAEDFVSCALEYMNSAVIEFDTFQYEIENCQVIWAIKDKSVGATFFDAGAAHFFLPCLKEAKQVENKPLKRLKYTLDDGKKVKTAVGNALGPDWSLQVNLKGKTKETRNVHVEYECEVRNIYQRTEFLNLNLKETTLQTEETWPVYVQLTNGTVVGCDFIISATGVIPNTKLALCGGLSLAEDGGIKVDDQMQTSVNNIFAAGDVCSVSWPLSKHWFQMRLWTQARQMGAYAAKCMSCYLNGTTAVLDACFDLFTHVTRFFGYRVVLLGLYNGQKLGTNYEILVRASERSEYVKVVVQDGRMQGAIVIGDTGLEETYENLILDQLDLSAILDDLLDPNIDIEDYFD